MNVDDVITNSDRLIDELKLDSVKLSVDQRGNIKPEVKIRAANLLEDEKKREQVVDAIKDIIDKLKVHFPNLSGF